MINGRRMVCWVWALVAVVSIVLQAGWALAQQGSISGTVVDPLGASVPGATVTLLRDGQSVTETSSGGRGEFAFQAVPAGRYQVEVRATGFEPRTTDQIFVGSSGNAAVEIALQIGPLRQEMVVTATAAEVPVSQVGSPVTVIDSGTLSELAKPDVLEALRTVPGAQIVQTGARGGTTSLFVRGGNANFNKVLIDGVPANDIGGAFDFADVATTGVDSVEVLRGSNSVLYGTDALTGVINVTTRRGRTRQPELSYSVDGGNLGTLREALSLSGVVKRFDYFMDYSQFDTDNHVPNSTFHNGTFAGRFGWVLGSATDLSVTVRRTDDRLGLPNGINYYAIADDSSQNKKFTYVGVTAQSQLTERLRTTVRFGTTDQKYHYENPAPTGDPFDPFGFGANYLGKPVTITGANGYTVSGRAILDFGGTYPSKFDSSAKRRLLFGQADYRFFDVLDVSSGVRYENEHGESVSTSRSKTDRDNVGYFVEARGNVRRRLYVNGGLGFDHNEVFKFAFTPRLSVAAYVRNPSSTAIFGDTKFTFNIGRGIKAPNLSQEQSSLYALLKALPQGSDLIATSKVTPIGPERSRSVDAGIEQGLWGGRARVRTGYFHNEFTDLIEFVSKTVLPQVGVPAAAAAATPFGAYVNSSSFRARGLETSAEAVVGRLVRIAGSYLYLDAIVQKSFSSGVLRPAINPAFPNIPIGQFSALVGGRPFRRPTHSGSLIVTYIQGWAQISLAGYFVGKQDASTFLSDGFFGYSLLLPNKDMQFGYQKVDLSGSYRFHPRLRWYASIENVLDRKYEAAAGFPALPRTLRTGLTVRLGGDASGTP